MPNTSVTKTTALPVTPQPTGTYAAAYGKLAAIAERLRTTATPSIDTLVEDLRAAREAYETCRERLAGIRREIEAEIAVTEAERA